MWIQQDAPTLVADTLRDILHDPGFLVWSELPDGWTPSDGPRVIVAPDGPQSSARGTDAEIVRIAVHARDQPTTRNLMTQIDGQLTTPGLRVLGFSIAQNTRMIHADSDVGGAVSSCTYRVGTTRKEFRYGTGT